MSDTSEEAGTKTINKGAGLVVICLVVLLAWYI